MDLRFRSDMTVELIDHMGSDASVVRAARVSTKGEASKGEHADKGLINMLMRDRHGTPFEHNAFTFYIEAPLFVFREFQRHRIASYNEESGRYKELEPVFYTPDAHRNLIQTGKPGAYTFEPGTEDQQEYLSSVVGYVAGTAFTAYQKALESGIAREVARIVLPLNIYSSMYVTMNARSLMNFLSLRTIREGSKFPSFPQREIEMVAEDMEDIWAGLMPETYKAFNANERVAP